MPLPTTDAGELMAVTTDESEHRLIDDGGTRSSGPTANDVWQPCATTLIVVALVAVTGIRGADYPAHLFRAALWRESGPSLWNFHWYGGHPTPTYGILSAPVVAVLGALASASLASVTSTYCFARLTTEHTSGRTTALANHVFGLLVTTNVIVGRIAFAIGLACALLAVLAWSHHVHASAIGVAGLASMASPVAGTFLALVSAAVLLDPTRRGPNQRIDRLIAGAVCTASLAPILASNLLLGVHGTFPFRGGHLAASITVLAAAARWCRPTIVRVAARLVAVASLVVFVVPNPLGGNAVRLAQIVGVPLLVVALGDPLRRRSIALGVTALVAIGWSLSPAVVAASASIGDASSEPSYHAPLVEQLRRRNDDGRPIGRLEIPFTRNHWESYYVATEVAFARGWERQADIQRNPELYDTELTETRYRGWLRDHAVRWIAIPDVALDHSGLREREIIERGDQSWRRLVWHDAHWKLFEVVDYTPIVDPPATLVQQTGDRIRVRVDRAATVTIRFVYDPLLTISAGGCVRERSGGWTEAVLPRAGEYELRVVLGPAAGSCPRLRSHPRVRPEDTASAHENVRFAVSDPLR